MSEPRSSFLARIGQQSGESGRATKYDPEFCMRVRMLAQCGDFPEAWAADIGVTLNTLRRWINEHPDFREGVTIAHHLLLAYWTREIAKHRNTDGAQPGMYALIIRRFPAIYGRAAIDLHQWLMTPPGSDDSQTGAGPKALVEIKTDDLDAKIAALEARRQHEKGTKT